MASPDPPFWTPSSEPKRLFCTVFVQVVAEKCVISSQVAQGGGGPTRSRRPPQRRAGRADGHGPRRGLLPSPREHRRQRVWPVAESPRGLVGGPRLCEGRVLRAPEAAVLALRRGDRHRAGGGPACPAPRPADHGAAGGRARLSRAAVPGRTRRGGVHAVLAVNEGRGRRAVHCERRGRLCGPRGRRPRRPLPARQRNSPSFQGLRCGR